MNQRKSLEIWLLRRLEDFTQWEWMLRKSVMILLIHGKEKNLKGNLKIFSHHFSGKESDELSGLTFCLKEKPPALQKT